MEKTFMKKAEECIKKRTDAHQLFVTAAAYQIFSNNLGKYLIIPTSTIDFLANIYTLFLGPSIISRKSTVLRLIKIMTVLEPMSDTYTFEAFVDEMSVAMEGWQNVTEAAGLLRYCLTSKSAHYRNLTGAYIQLFSNESVSRTTKSSGKVEVEDAFFNLNAATTDITALKYLTSAEALETGFISRFLMPFVSEEEIDLKPRSFLTNKDDMKALNKEFANYQKKIELLLKGKKKTTRVMPKEGDWRKEKKSKDTLDPLVGKTINSKKGSKESKSINKEIMRIEAKIASPELFERVISEFEAKAKELLKNSLLLPTISRYTDYIYKLTSLRALDFAISYAKKYKNDDLILKVYLTVDDAKIVVEFLEEIVKRLAVKFGDFVESNNKAFVTAYSRVTSEFKRRGKLKEEDIFNISHVDEKTTIVVIGTLMKQRKIYMKVGKKTKTNKKGRVKYIWRMSEAEKEAKQRRTKRESERRLIKKEEERKERATKEKEKEEYIKAMEKRVEEVQKEEEVDDEEIIKKSPKLVAKLEYQEQLDREHEGQLKQLEIERLKEIEEIEREIDKEVN